MSSAETEAAWPQLIEVYYKKFDEICNKLGVKTPWSLESFAKEAREMGLFLCFLWCGLSHELVFKFPEMKERFIWVAEKSIELTPEKYTEA